MDGHFALPSGDKQTSCSCLGGTWFSHEAVSRSSLEYSFGRDPSWEHRSCFLILRLQVIDVQVVQPALSTTPGMGRNSQKAFARWVFHRSPPQHVTNIQAIGQSNEDKWKTDLIDTTQ